MSKRYILSAAALCVLIAFFYIQLTRQRTSNNLTINRSEDTSFDNTRPDPGTAAPAGPQPGVPADAPAVFAPPASKPKESQARSPYLDLSDPESRAGHVAALVELDRQERAAAHLQAEKLGMPKAWTRDGKTFELTTIRNGRVYVRETRNVNAGISTRADKVRLSPYERDGSGVTVAVWDAGAVRSTHDEFTGRVDLKNVVPPHNHASHVGGTIGAIGTNASAIGMAPQVLIDSYDWVSDLAEIAQRAMASPGEPGKIQLSNHSYGFAAGWSGIDWFGTWGNRESDSFGLYDSMSAALDEIAYGAPYYLHFKAAGNDRNDNAPSQGVPINYFDESGLQTKPYDPATDPFSDGWDNGGFDTISLEACAKNIITVGAVNDAVTVGEHDISKATMTSFSSWGPADDGRVKPDIVANGASLFSAASAGDDIYSVLSGTSMATPNVMGSAALLVEHYNDRFPGMVMRASTIKGLLIHTAQDLGNPGPDYSYGWGLVDALTGVRHIEAHYSLTNGYRMLEDHVTELNSTNRYMITWNRSDPITVTMCWTDPAGMVRDGLDIRTPSLVHDLDVRVIGPGAETYSPFVLSFTNPIANAFTGDNNIDNVEQVIVTNPMLPGNYEVVITLDGNLTDDEQFYSLLVGGITLPPEIEHTELINTANEDVPYVVNARIISEQSLNPDTVRLLWSTTGPGGGFTPVAMTPTSNDIYSATIPASPSGTTIDYVIEASTTNGLSSSSPPIGTHRFEVVEPVVLLVTGDPSDFGFPDPEYGIHTFASGITVHARGDVFTVPVGGTRNISAGWEGFGSVPAVGNTNELDFEIHRQSALEWQWKPGYRLSETSSIPGIIERESWWIESTTSQTAAATASYDGNGTNYIFAGWYVDGSRIPDGIVKAENPAYPIIMDAPKTAVALYLTEDEDLDLDTVSDWWEFLFLGSTGVALNVDLDNDGFTSISEYRDGTDPHDNTSFPSAPSIAHVPLNNALRLPAPYLISADVIDNFILDRVNLEWNVNGAGWLTTPMEPGASSITYTSAIPSPAVTGDQFQYRIVARDASGLQAVNGIYTVDIRYPVMSLSPTNFGTVFLASNIIERVAFTVGNDGHDALEWSLTVKPAGLYDNVESGTNGWTHGGANDVWHISSRRAYSGSNSWYFGSPATARYPDSAKAWLISPPVFIAEDSVFSYWQWLDTEEPQGPTTAWDGSIVELSTNNGTSFFQIDPVGGYPYEIFWHPASAFPSNTQLFAGTVDWEKQEFPLGDYAGQVVRLRMHFGSDGFATAEGWYVDDLFVNPYGGASDWLDIAATNGSVDQLDSESEQAFLNTSSLDLSETRRAVIYVDSNDPVNPMGLIPIGLHNASREIVVQVSGNGTVSPSGPVYLALGDTTNFSVEAEALNAITEITTNGVSVGNVFGMIYTNFVWSEIDFNGTGVFHVVFEPILTTNGVPEVWLVAHGLTNGTPENEALTDHDLDTLLTWQEFIAGTDPTNSDSVFLLPSAIAYGDYVAHAYTVTGYDGTLFSGTQFIFEVTGHSIAWPSVSNRVYRLYQATNVVGDFAVASPSIAATPPTNTYINTPDDLRGGYYRLGVELAE
jgi:hypothetical protein